MFAGLLLPRVTGQSKIGRSIEMVMMIGVLDDENNNVAD